jgi:competence protein ComEC
VAHLPGAEGRIPSFGVGALLLASTGFLLLAIPVSKLKYLGAPFLAVALFFAVHAPKPDVLIDPEAKTVAVRAADGRLTILNARQGRISAETWLAADGDTRKSRDVLDKGFRCDGLGCIARLPDGTVVAVATRPEAFADDCREAGVVISAFDIPAACKAPGIDRKMLSTTGAISLRRENNEWKIETVRKPYADRPWYGRAKPADPEVLDRFRKAELVKKTDEAPLAPAGDIPVPEADEDND